MVVSHIWRIFAEIKCVLRQNEVRYWLYLMDFCRNFQRDGGRPTAFGMQVLIANHFVLL